MNLSENKITLVTTLEPCLMCFGASMLSNVNEIVYAYEDVMGGGMDCDVSKLTSLYKHRQITVVSNVLRKESLKLFKAFFQNPSNIYWKGSLLAEYTLKQQRALKNLPFCSIAQMDLDLFSCIFYLHLLMMLYNSRSF